jgi:hypothetical protein
MKVILIAKRGLGTNIVRILRQIPEVKVDWFTGVQQTGNDFYLGNDVQMLYPVVPNRQKTELQAVDLTAYQLAIVAESDYDSGCQFLPVARLSQLDFATLANVVNGLRITGLRMS